MTSFTIIDWQPCNIFNSTDFMSTRVVLHVKTQVWQNTEDTQSDIATQNNHCHKIVNSLSGHKCINQNIPNCH